MSTFVFYQKVAALSSDVHRNLRLSVAESGFGFASSTNSVPIAAVEFAQAGHDYPIVFVRGEDRQIRPVALLGVRPDENLFVDEQGHWDGRYIPAFVRRYPFVMAKGAEPDQLVVCIDEYSPALNADHGELLFDSEGQLAPRMNKVMQFLQNVQQDFMRTELLIQQLDALGLFIQQGASFDTHTGEIFQLDGFYMIDEAKFGQIEDARLPDLFRSGALGLVYLHLASMRNMHKLLERVSMRAAMQSKKKQRVRKK